MDKSGKTAEGRWKHPAFFAIFDQTDRIAALQQRPSYKCGGKKLIDNDEGIWDILE